MPLRLLADSGQLAGFLEEAEELVRDRLRAARGSRSATPTTLMEVCLVGGSVREKPDT